MDNSQKEKVYVLTDIETTGKSPLLSSCIMIKCIVFKDIDITNHTPRDEWILEEKKWYIKEQEDKKMDDGYFMDYWAHQMKYLDYIRSHAVDPKIALKSFMQWYIHVITNYECCFLTKKSSYVWQWINCFYEEYGPVNKPSFPDSVICLDTLGKLFTFIGTSWDNLVGPTLNVSKIDILDEDTIYKQAFFFIKTIQWLRQNVKH